jgi:hypothetical protein
MTCERRGLARVRLGLRERRDGRLRLVRGADSEAAWAACSCVSASTTAIGWPFQWIRSSCMIGMSLTLPAMGDDPNAGGTFIVGAFRCVITSTTPGAASAALVSSVAMRPLATVLKASEA